MLAELYMVHQIQYLDVDEREERSVKRLVPDWCWCESEHLCLPPFQPAKEELASSSHVSLLSSNQFASVHLNKYANIQYPIVLNIFAGT